jgi:hypothetical protein
MYRFLRVFEFMGRVVYLTEGVPGARGNGFLRLCARLGLTRARQLGVLVVRKSA